MLAEKTENDPALGYERNAESRVDQEPESVTRGQIIRYLHQRYSGMVFCMPHDEASTGRKDRITPERRAAYWSGVELAEALTMRLLPASKIDSYCGGEEQQERERAETAPPSRGRPHQQAHDPELCKW